MNFSNNVINILAAKTYKGIGAAWIVKNIKGNEEIEDIVSLIRKSNAQNSQITIEEFSRVQDKIREELISVSSEFDGVVAIGDSHFPAIRGKVKESSSPVVLFYKGEIRLLARQNFNIAVIGLLKPTEAIEAREQKVVAELVQCGATIVSGLALGCDSIAHKEALKSGGTTIAVLPSTLNKISPPTNKKLAEEIISNGGLVISEYYKEPTSRNVMISRYIERDRLQAMFSDGIVLSASYAKNNQGNDSGSRHAMQYAKDYSLPRAVMYNRETDATDEQFALNKQLIQEDSSVCLLAKKTIQTFIEEARFVKQQKSVKELEQGTLV